MINSRNLAALASAALILASGVPAWARQGETPPTATLSSTRAIAPDTSLIDDKAIADIHAWLDSPVVHTVVNAQSKANADIDQARIDELDKVWRAQREERSQPLVASVMANPLSTYLLRVQAMSTGLYTEIIIMDAKGLNVALSNISSDYWQGDEAKYQKTFLVGPDAVFIDEAEKHDGTGTWRAQVNLTITDDQGDPIGAAAVEMNLTELARRRSAGL